MANIDWQNLKDWAREEYRLRMANSAGVDLDEIIMPGDDDPRLNIVLRNKRDAEVNECELDINAHKYCGNEESRDEGVPSIEDMMLLDALDGSIDASWDVF